MLKRGGYLLSAIGYAGITISAIKMLMGVTSNEPTIDDLSQMIMAYPPGRWLIGLTGLGVIIVAIVQFYRAIKGETDDQLKYWEMNSAETSGIKRLGQIGYSARSFVYLIIGLFLIQAAVRFDPTEAGGLADALQALSIQPYGPWVLGLTAFGLIAYGIYAVGLAIYRQIHIR